MGYVEGLNDARTKLADFFSILLEEIDHNAKMHSMTLKVISDAWHVVQLLPPIDFEDWPCRPAGYSTGDRRPRWRAC